MATTTQHLGMTLPGYADAADVAVLNANTTILDNAVYGNRQMLAYVEETNIATKNHNGGELLVVGGQLVKATVNIAIGDSFVMDSNIEATTIADEIGSGGGGGGGSSSTDYSTTEQIIGTYNGRTLYQRMYEKTTSFATTQSIAVDSSIDNLIILGGYVEVSSGASSYQIPLNYTESGYSSYCGYQSTTHSIFINVQGWTSTKAVVIAQYTKSI